MTIHQRRDVFDIDASLDELAGLTLPARLRRIRGFVTGSLIFTTSFGLEDQALTHAVVEAGIDVDFVTLDTGRLFDETLELWADTELRYGLSIQALAPDGGAAERLVARDGPLGFRRSVEARQACCGVRKVEPLGRALAGADGWLTGLRADQSAARSATPFVVRDHQHGVLKFSPLADWSRDDVAGYVRLNEIPYNRLHDRGFLSIGCAPCTRALRVGEPERAGRWWWESEGRKECGLHAGPAHLPTAEPIPALG